MSGDRQFDFWYAVNHTHVLILPKSRLETFGTSMVNYHLLTELMDSNKVRIREGRIEAYRPEIITPENFTKTMLEGFGGPEASQYLEWLREHEKDLMILKYGFAIRKQEINDHIVSETLSVAIDRVREALAEKDDPLSAMVVGVDEPWEVCLIKLMQEVVQQSAPKHAMDLRRDPKGYRHEIEKDFADASLNRAKLSALGEKLQKLGLFEEYEDRFYALVRSR